MGIFIETPGVLTTVQDGGRYGYEQFGVSPSGPMDLESFQLANILVGNPRDLSALEATMLGPTLRFTRDNIIAITGGDMTPLLNEQPVPMNQAILIRSGSVLKLRAARTGCRTYVAFAGGLDVPEVMGSRATGVQNRVGGLEGRKLAKGDELPFLAPKTALPRMEERRTSHPMPAGKERVLRVILGPQDDAFTQQGLDTFLGQPYQVTNDFDRMLPPGRAGHPAQGGRQHHLRRHGHRGHPGAHLRPAHHHAGGAADCGRLYQDRHCDHRGPSRYRPVPSRRYHPLSVGPCLPGPPAVAGDAGAPQ